MMTRLFTLVASVGILLGLAGCIQQQPYTVTKRQIDSPIIVEKKPDLIAVNYKAIDSLVEQIKPTMGNDSPIIVATAVNINQLEISSPLGRVISEHALGRFAQLGFWVIELKIRDKVYMRRHEGEFLLTREIRELARSHNAQAVVIGTYAEASDRVFVSLKVVETENSRVIGAVDYAIAKDEVTRSLLYRAQPIQQN